MGRLSILRAFLSPKWVRAVVTTALAIVLPVIAVAQSALPVQWVYNPIGWTESVAYSPDGTLLAVGGAGGVQIFAVSTGALLRCLPTAVNSSGENSTIQSGASSIAFSPNSQLLAVAGQHFSQSGNNLVETGVLELWNVSTGALINSLKTIANQGVFSVAFSPNGTTLADGGQYNTTANPNDQYGVLEVWNASTGELINSLNTATARGGCVNSVAFSPNGATLVDGGEFFANGGSGGSGAQLGIGGVIELWNVSNGSLTASLSTAASSSVNSVAISQDGVTLADGGEGWDTDTNTSTGVLELWNISNEKLISSLNTSANSGVASVTFSPNGASIADGGASGGGNGVMEQWSVSSGALVRTFATANPEVKSVAFSPNGTTLVDGGSTNPSSGLFTTGVAEEWSVSTGGLLTTLNTTLNSGVTSVAISPDGKTLAVGEMTNATSGGIANGLVQLWDIPSGTLTTSFSIPTNNSFMPVVAVGFSPDSKTIAVGSVHYSTEGYSGILELWSVSTGTLIKSLNTAATNGITSVAFSPDGTMLADGGRNNTSGTLELWNVSTGTLIASLPTVANSGLNSVAFSPDGKTLADGGLGYEGTTNFGVLELWNTSTDKLISTLSTAAVSGVNSVAFSADGKSLADGGQITNSSSGAQSGVLELWNVSTSVRLSLLSLVNGTTSIQSVAISPDNQVLFAGSSTNLQAYSMANYGLLGYYVDESLGIQNTYPVTGLGIAANGSFLAYGSFQSIVVSGNPFYNPIAISSISINPQTIMGGASSTGTVTLSQPAPSGGDTVTLISGNGSVRVPGSVTVAPGATQATFAITTQPLSSSSAVVITATSGGASANATLNVSNLSVTEIGLNPTSVPGGNSSAGNITLSGPAPTAGITISLASDNNNAAVPNTLFVAGGETTGTFTVNTSVVSAQTTATITAGSGTGSKSILLTITPNVLSSVSLNPSTLVGGSSSIGTVKLSGPAGPGGAMVSLTTTGDQVNLPTTITIAAGQSSATFTLTTLASGSNQTVTITASLNSVSKTATLTIEAPAIASLNFNPATVTGGSSSMATVNLTGSAGPGGMLIELSSSNKQATNIPQSVTVQEGQSTAAFTVNTLAVSTKITVTVTAGNKGASKSATLTISPPTVTALSLSPTTIAGGIVSIGSVTLSGPAPKSAVSVKLMSNSSSATVPGSVTVSNGKSSATFTVKTSAVSVKKTVTITASLNGSSQVASLAINPPTLLSLTLSPSSVKGGKPSTGTVTISSIAPAGGLVITLSSNLGAATVGKSVTIPAGKTSAAFTVKTTSVKSSTSATITATFGSASKTAALTIS